MVTERIQRRIDSLLDEASEAFAQGQWEAVLDRSQKVLALDPDNPDGLAFLEATEKASSAAAPSRPACTSDLSAPTPAKGTKGQSNSFANGRYEVKRFLGEGGKKKVYLAYDTLLDREVAFSLIKTEGLDEASRTRITREAQAMGRLGSHPHIVTVFDLGQEGEQPYMVTELMGGGDVEDVIEKAPNHRVPLEQVLSITRETCRGLEFAHSRGIVHRDLKPGNVWLTHDGVAKIGDFGLAVAIDRSRLTAEGTMVGTVSYMPPEQATGGDVTPKADLYSLGAMLYELITGRPPFLGDDFVSIIGQHINTPPVAPTWKNPQCPRSLEVLIMRLLAKNPEERPESASDVLTALDGVDLTLPVESDPHMDEARTLDSLAGGIFVGRQSEMGELKASLEDTISGRGRLVTLVGEPGIGKTRTALELATFAGLRGVQVLWGRCYEGEGAPPFWPWVQAIRSYVSDVDPQQLHSEMGSGAAVIAEVVSDVRDQLPGLPAPSQLEPEQARFRLFDSITAFLKRAGHRKPLVLVLDDLHWADHPSLLLLEFVARELASARVMIIGTYRDMELSRQHPLSRSLGQLNLERLFQRVLLRGLEQDDVARFIELACGVTPPHGMVEALHRQTEGNPLFVTEMVRLLAQEGELTQEKASQRDSWHVRIPEGVKEVIGLRLDRLSVRSNEALTMASVIGREFTLDQLKPLVEDMTEDGVLEVLEEALSARIIEEMPRTVGRYNFTHTLIQETLTQELTLARRVRLHAQIAESLEELYAGNVEDHAAELARHFAEAEAVLGTSKLVTYSLLAGNRALAALAYEESLIYFQRALDARNGQPTDADTSELLFGLGRAQVAALPRSRLAEALTTLRRSFDYFVESGNIQKVAAVAEIQIPSGSHLTGWVEVISRALELTEPDSVSAARILCNHGRILGDHEGDPEGSSRSFDQALTIARRLGDEGLEFRILSNSARIDAYQLRLADSVQKNLRAIDLSRHADDLRAEASSQLYVALAQTGLGELESARQHATRLLDITESLHDLGLSINTFNVNNVVASLTGDWKNARKLSDRAMALDNQDPTTLCLRVNQAYEAGDHGQGDMLLERLSSLVAERSSEGYLTMMFIPAVSSVSRITGVIGRIEGMEDIAASYLSSMPPIPIYVLYVNIGLAFVAVLREDALAASQQYTALEPHRGTLAPHFRISIDRMLGLLSQTMGNLDQAAEHYQDSMAFCRDAGYRPELAWSCCDCADMLLQRNTAGDHENSTSLLDESLALSTELGMRPLMERVLLRRSFLNA